MSTISFDAFISGGFYFLKVNGTDNNIDSEISGALTTLPSGCTLILPDRPLTITQPIVLRNRQSLRGGSNTSIKAHNIVGPAIRIIGRYGFVENLWITGNKISGSVGISVDGGDNGIAEFQLNSVYVNSFEAGVSLKNCWRGSVNKCCVTSNDIGIKMERPYVNAVSIDRGSVSGNRIGIFFEPTNQYYLKNNINQMTIEGNKEYGIYISGSAWSNSVRDCCFEANGKSDVVVNHYNAVGTIIDGCFSLRTPLSIDIQQGTRTFIHNNFIRSGTNPPYNISEKAKNTVMGKNCQDTTGKDFPTVYNKSTTTTFIT